MLSIVLPAYNEVGNVGGVVDSILKFVPTVAENYEIVVVDDGSRDGTKELINELAGKYSQLVALRHSLNKGYGATLRSGFQAAQGELIFFTDGDGQFDIRELPKLISLIKKGADIACGYRIRRADPLIRAVNAAIYSRLVGLLFDLNLKDINCAFKLFKREVLQNIGLQSDGAFISSEFLILAKKNGYTIRQIGVSHFSREKGEQTGNNIIVVLKAFTELVEFWRKIKGGG